MNDSEFAEHKWLFGISTTEHKMVRYVMDQLGGPLEMKRAFVGREDGASSQAVRDAMAHCSPNCHIRDQTAAYESRGSKDNAQWTTSRTLE